MNNVVVSLCMHVCKFYAFVYHNIDCFLRLFHQKIGLYFSGHWCPPCRAFTPQLISTYNTLRNKGHDFEVGVFGFFEGDGGIPSPSFYGYSSSGYSRVRSKWIPIVLWWRGSIFISVGRISLSRYKKRKERERKMGRSNDKNKLWGKGMGCEVLTGDVFLCDCGIALWIKLMR